MIKLYFKQAWMLMKQNRFYSFIYIVGTGLSISMVMVLAIVFYVRIADTYPENNRSRMLIVKNARVRVPDNYFSSSLSLKTVETCFYSLEKAEAVSAVYEVWENQFFIQSLRNREQIPVKLKCVDSGFWKVFSFKFREGAPFTEEDMESGIKTVVITETLSRQVFGHKETVGEYLSVNFVPYRICGVVKDVPFLSSHAYANIWMPYTAYPDLETWWKSWSNDTEPLGNFVCYILSPSVQMLSQVRSEAVENIHKYDASSDRIEFDVFDQPDSQWQFLLRSHDPYTYNFRKLLLIYGIIFFILLFIPAVSLTGLTDSQMEVRLAEMGVRRSFGASRSILMKQVIIENLLYTLLGGVTGLFISYVIVWGARQWIFYIGSSFLELSPENIDMFSPLSLINYKVLIIAFLICLIFNLMAAVIPAWRFSSREIVESLNAK